MTDSKTQKVAGIIEGIHQLKPKNLLAVGCGSGVEAAILAQQLSVEVVGIDIEDNFNEEASKYANLQKGDATSIQFRDESFDFVYSYHSLEHIKNPRKALREMSRVLKKSGGYWIGTPNRSRIIGYIGSSDATFAQKLRLNLTDWKARLTGEFRNELGANAGFTSRELRSLLSEFFSEVNDVTKTYFLAMHENHPLLLRLIGGSGLSEFIYPSVYFSGIK
jgi:ubiquinone/menaquinone biosynthesis C-methylase UbiE